MAARGVRGGDRRRTQVVLLTSAALVAALSFAQPALAEDATDAPAADATSTVATSPDPAPTPDPATDGTGSTEPAAPDPEPTQPQPTPQDPPGASDSTATEPAQEPAGEPPGPVVTMEPEPVVTSECTAAGGAEGALTGTCEAAAPDPTAEPPHAACDPSTTDGAEAPSGCTGQNQPGQTDSVPSSTATTPKVAATPTASSEAPAAPVVLVVSLAPEQPAAAPAHAAVAAGLEDSIQASDEPWATIAPTPAVELVSLPQRIAQIAEAESALGGVGGVAAISAVPEARTIMNTNSLANLPAVIEAIATARIVQAARASPAEQDGRHRAADTEEEEERAEPSAGVNPTGPLDRQGLGSSGGSAGGVAGAASLRYFAIAATPTRFDFPSTFSHAPLSSSVPEGALAARPTSRPG